MGARFEALDEGVLAAASKSTGYFLSFQCPRKCGAWEGSNAPYLRYEDEWIAMESVVLPPERSTSVYKTKWVEYAGGSETLKVKQDLVKLIRNLIGKFML